MKFGVKFDKNKDNLSKWLARAADPLNGAELTRIGQLGVDELRRATPKNTGMTADSWTFNIVDRINANGIKTIEWSNAVQVGNSNVPLAVLRQLGHADRAGGWVPGVDFMNPAMQTVSREAIGTVTGAVQRIP